MGADPVSLAVTVALNAASMAMTASRKIEGPRLTDLKGTTASYGTPLNYFYGTRRFDGVTCFWSEDLKEVKRKRKTKGGKFNEYTYYGTWAVVIADHEIDAVTRIWFDRHLVYDATGKGPISPFHGLGDIQDYMRVYLGTADQEADARISATVDEVEGEGSTPAYRGMAYIVFQELPLERIGNRLPQITVEATAHAADGFPVDVRTAQTGTSFYNMFGFTYSPDGTRVLFGMNGDYEIWDVAARSLMISGEFPASMPGSLGLQPTYGVANNGNIYLLSSLGTFLDNEVVVLRPDGTGLASSLYPVFGGASLMVLSSANGNPSVYSVLYGTFNGGYSGGGYIDTAVRTGGDWQIKFYFRDTYGDTWCVGGGGDLAPNVCAFLRLVDTGVRAGPSVAFVTMPNAHGGLITEVMAYHYKDATHDHFVVGWGDGSQHLVTVDIATFAITHDRAYNIDPYNGPRQFQFIQPGAISIFLGYDEISSKDLTTIRSVDPADFGYDNLLSGMIYDRVNHALLTALPGNVDFAWFYLDRVDGEGVSLRSIVEDIAARCGLSADDVTATDLTQAVPGYSWTQGTGKQILEPLLEAYNSEARPHDFALEFLKRGVATLGPIETAQMGAATGRGAGSRYQVERTLDTDLPQSVNLTFADLDADQQPNTAVAQRPHIASDSRRELSLDLTTLALDIDRARVMAHGYLRRQWHGSETIRTTLTRGWSGLEPGDGYTLFLDDMSRKAKVRRLEFGADGVLALEWQRYLPTISEETLLPGAPADGLERSELPVFGYTRGVVLDVPLAVDAHEDLIVYLSAAPYSTDTAWPGATFYQGDDGITFDNAFGDVGSTEEGTIGYTLAALPEALPEVWDRQSSVTVKLFAGELASVTEAQVENGANLALIGEELVGFSTATLVDVATYALSGFLRGRRGTEAKIDGHLSGDQFVLMSETVRVDMGASDLGDLAYYQPITNGGATGFPQELTFTGASLKPYSPAHLAAIDESGDLVATWVRRTRIGGAWRDFEDASLGEGSEAYEADVLDAGGGVIRSFTGLSSPTLTYTAAQQATDAGAGEALRVYQISSTVGRGFSADLAI